MFSHKYITYCDIYITAPPLTAQGTLEKIGQKKKQKPKLVDDYEETLSPGHSRAQARMNAQRM